MQRLNLAILRHPGKRVVGVGNAGVVVKRPAGELTETKIHRGHALHRSSQELGKLLFVVKAVRHMIKDLEIIGQQVERGLQVVFVKGVTELSG